MKIPPDAEGAQRAEKETSDSAYDIDRDLGLLDRYLSGTCSADETARVRERLAVDPRFAVFNAALRDGIRTGGAAEFGNDDAAWARIRTARQGHRGEVVARRAQRKNGESADRFWLRRSVLGRQALPRDRALGKQTLFAWKKAAYMVSSFVIVAVVTFGAVQSNRRHDTFPILPIHTYTIPAGLRATVTLADGSHALLGPATTLSVTTDFANRQVTAQVSGEALFTVVPRSNTSFQVQTGNAVTRVLGTKFLVRRYSTDPVTQVVVVEGRVSVSNMRSRTRSAVSILTTRVLGTVDDSGHVVVTPNITVDGYTAWTTGRLEFRDATLHDVVSEVGRAYNVEIRIADSARAERHLNWTISVAQRSLAGVLESLADLLDAHPVRAGRIITFVSGRAASHRFPAPLSSTLERQYGK